MGSADDTHKMFFKNCPIIHNSKREYTVTQTHRQHGDSISLLLYFEKKENRLKMLNGTE
jgi:hypothetical protein